jgi:hypothetical protein
VSVPTTSVLGAHLTNEATMAAFSLQTGGAGIVLGLNSQNAPVVATLFRPEPTRVTLFGTVRCAQLIAFRALALGARLAIQSSQPAVWGTFLRGAGVQPHEADLLPPGAPAAMPMTGAGPQLVIQDTGSSSTEPPQDGAGWRATLTLRTELTPWDFEAMTGADLVIMQPLSPAEAALAAPALGLDSGVQRWLAEIRPDMVTLVHRGTVRWAVLAPTTVEGKRIGPVVRDLAAR